MCFVLPPLSPHPTFKIHPSFPYPFATRGRLENHRWWRLTAHTGGMTQRRTPRGNEVLIRPKDGEEKTQGRRLGLRPLTLLAPCRLGWQQWEDSRLNSSPPGPGPHHLLDRSWRQPINYGTKWGGFFRKYIFQSPGSHFHSAYLPSPGRT